MKANFKWVLCKYCNQPVGAGSFKPLFPRDYRVLRAECPNCHRVLTVNIDGDYLDN